MARPEDAQKEVMRYNIKRVFFYLGGPAPFPDLPPRPASPVRWFSAFSRVWGGKTYNCRCPCARRWAIRLPPIAPVATPNQQSW